MDDWDDITDHFESPYHNGLLQFANARGAADNPSCGDSAKLELRIDHGRVMEAWHTGSGCIISQACLSMLVQSIEGKLVSELKEITAEQWLDRFACVHTARRKMCVLLSWKALQEALGVSST